MDTGAPMDTAEAAKVRHFTLADFQYSVKTQVCVANGPWKRLLQAIGHFYNFQIETFPYHTKPYLGTGVC